MSLGLKNLKLDARHLSKKPVEEDGNEQSGFVKGSEINTYSNKEEAFVEFTKENQLILNRKFLTEQNHKGLGGNVQVLESFWPKPKNNKLSQPLKEEVFLSSCFPMSAPNQFISLRDKENREVCLVKDVANLDDKSAKAINSAIQLSQFSFEILEVLELKQSFELRIWKVKTVLGERKFQTEMDAWPLTVCKGVLLFKDVYGDHYTYDSLKQSSRFTRMKMELFLK